MADRLTREELEAVALYEARNGITRVPAGQSGYRAIWDGNRLTEIGTAKSNWNRGMRPKPAHWHQVAADIRDGKGYEALKARHGICRDAIYKIARHFGLRVRPAYKPMPKPQLCEQLTAQITVLANGRRGVDEIARLVPCDRASVLRRKEKFDLNIPDGRSLRRTG